ncbi:hypothetical protein Bca52824_060782 [Brassica carinata]|uniref:WRKY19-like zinc finger domain-containing protein n=1 Tax=Brassica carinata TaxID=52824 RepID=A0A8X7QYA2_BRACI|nr:hypothetical protein Bca52824_060782 [Brassica carinata]
MEENEPFVLDEVDDEQSPQSNQTWPMDVIRQRRFQHKMSSLLSPVTPKRNYSVSNANPSQALSVSCSDEGVLMDGVLVTSASEKKVSDSPSRLSSLGRSPRSSLVRSQHKKSSPRSLSGGNQEDTTRSQTSSGEKVKMLADSPCTKLETPKAVNPSKLNATAEPFTFTPRPSQGLASPLLVRQLPFDHGPRIQWATPPPHQQLRPPHLYLPPCYPYPRSLQVPDLYPTRYPFRSPGPIGFQMRHGFNQSPARNDPRIISPLPTTPLTTNTSKPPVQTPISTIPTPNLSTSNTTQDSSLSVDGGGRRCGFPEGCGKAARDKSGLCIKHGGGKRCRVEGCKRSAEGQAGLCISHGGGRRCQSLDCTKGAQGVPTTAKVMAVGNVVSLVDVLKELKVVLLCVKHTVEGNDVCLMEVGYVLKACMVRRVSV